MTEETPELETTEETPEVETEETPTEDATLGDAGKKAIDSMKSKWHTERDKRRELEAELEKLRSSSTSDDGGQPNADSIRAEAAREATAKANARILKSEVKAAAAGKLADPADALRYLDLDKFEVDESGDVDADEIKEAIDSLLTDKPYLGAAKARFQGTGDGGAARKAPGPSQLTRDDLKKMTAEQINQAKHEGRLNDVLGISK